MSLSIKSTAQSNSGIKAAALLCHHTILGFLPLRVHKSSLPGHFVPVSYRGAGMTKSPHKAVFSSRAIHTATVDTLPLACLNTFKASRCGVLNNPKLRLHFVNNPQAMLDQEHTVAVIYARAMLIHIAETVVHTGLSYNAMHVAIIAEVFNAYDCPTFITSKSGSRSKYLLSLPNVSASNAISLFS
jgi:hypothetical protein